MRAQADLLKVALGSLGESVREQVALRAAGAMFGFDPESLPSPQTAPQYPRLVDVSAKAFVHAWEICPLIGLPATYATHVGRRLGEMGFKHTGSTLAQQVRRLCDDGVSRDVWMFSREDAVEALQHDPKVDGWRRNAAKRG